MTDAAILYLTTLLAIHEELVLMCLLVAAGSRDEFAITAWLEQHAVIT